MDIEFLGHLPGSVLGQWGNQTFTPECPHGVRLQLLSGVPPKSLFILCPVSQLICILPALVTCPVPVIKYHQKQPKKEKDYLAHLLRLQSIVGGGRGSQQQELEVSGHTACILKKGQGYLCSAYSSFCNPRAQGVVPLIVGRSSHLN